MRVSGAFVALSFLLASCVTAYPAENPQKRNSWSPDCEDCLTTETSKCIYGFTIRSQINAMDKNTVNMAGVQCTFDGKCASGEAARIVKWMGDRGYISGLGQDSPNYSSGGSH